MPPKFGPKKEEVNKEISGEIIALLVGLFILSVIVVALGQYLSGWGTSWELIWAKVRDFLVYVLWPWVKYLAILLSALSIILIVYSWMKLREINLEEKGIYNPSPKTMVEDGIVVSKNGKWLKVVEHINSPNTSDWRLAIIEADIMLDELLRSKGYQGDTVGDMMKAVDKSDMLSLEAAWEAHKIRNKIAHSGSEFPLNEREAKRAVALYEAVFKEFAII